MRCWSRFGGGDRCSLGPDWLETWWQLGWRQVAGLWYERNLSSAGSRFGSQHVDDQTQERTQSDHLPGDPAQASLSRARLLVAAQVPHRPTGEPGERWQIISGLLLLREKVLAPEERAAVSDWETEFSLWLFFSLLMLNYFFAEILRQTDLFFILFP